MTISVYVDTVRRQYLRAKKGHLAINPGLTPMTFWESFGAANNMKCVIVGHMHHFPIVERLEFADEESYAWFLLKWG